MRLIATLCETGPRVPIMPGATVLQSSPTSLALCHAIPLTLHLSSALKAKWLWVWVWFFAPSHDISALSGDVILVNIRTSEFTQYTRVGWKICRLRRSGATAMKLGMKLGTTLALNYYSRVFIWKKTTRLVSGKLNLMHANFHCCGTTTCTKSAYGLFSPSSYLYDFPELWKLLLANIITAYSKLCGRCWNIIYNGAWSICNLINVSGWGGGGIYV